MTLKDLLGVGEEASPEQLASKIPQHLNDLLRKYGELTREEKIAIGRSIPLLYPNLSQAPPELQSLEYVGAYSEGLVVRGGSYGNWALYRARRPIVLRGHFGYGALGESEEAVVLGGFFTTSAFWAAKKPIVVGGQLGQDAFLRAEGVKCYVNTIGSLCETLSGVIVAKKLGSVVAPASTLTIYCVEVDHGSEHCIKINEEDFDDQLTLDGLEKALEKLKLKYGNQCRR